MLKGLPHRSVTDVRGARLVLSQSLLALEIEQAGIINAFGRTLAEDLVTSTPTPPHDTAAINGYAAIASDTTGAGRPTPCKLSVMSSSSASGKRIEPGTVMRVKQGEPLPHGADTVVELSQAFRPEHGPEVLIFSEMKPGENVILEGSTTPAGEVILRGGSVIGAAEMGLIASMGRPGIPVRRKPRLAIITTGSEVVDILDKLHPGAVRNSARYTLVGMILDSGCDLGRLIHIKDGRIGLEKALADSTGYDATIVALGPNDKHDIALQALANSGELLFNRVQMQPGAATAFAMVNDRPVFVTESIPVIEAFEAIIRPGLMLLSGRDNLDRMLISAQICSAIKLDPGHAHYLKAVTTLEDGKCLAKLIGSDTPHIQPNSLIHIPENIDFVKRGEDVEVIILHS